MARPGLAPQHHCRPSLNPRLTGRCDCGQPLSQPLSRPRDLEQERQLTHEAARGVADPSRLIVHAETRASQPREYGHGHQVRTGVDWLHELRAELADARNYACWWLQEHPGEEPGQDVLIALRLITLAYQRLPH